MKTHEHEQYQDMIARLYPEIKSSDGGMATRSITFQVTDDCNLACTYCYQINKGKRVMKFETAKKAIDMLFIQDGGMSCYMSEEINPAICLEFIGGEPFLQAELIEQICDYFVEKAIMERSTWAEKFMISVCSNGVLYFDEKVQHFLNKYKSKLSFSVTIDGNKELHDKCRVFPDGKPSYDLAVAAAKDWIDRGGYMGSKITIAPENLDYIYDAIVHMVTLGYTEINANTVYEKGWTIEHAKKFYIELKRIADYFIDNDLTEDTYCSLFTQTIGKPMSKEDNQNWCGGNGVMLSVDPDGHYYPCIRYMESSLGEDAEPYRIGHVDRGIGQTKAEQSKLKCLACITRKSQSTEECFNCPIAQGCAWCTAYNYQVNGTPDSRCIYICDMHKARTLANTYFWNKFYRKLDVNERVEVHCPEDWALEIIDKEELDYLRELEKR